MSDGDRELAQQLLAQERLSASERRLLGKLQNQGYLTQKEYHAKVTPEYKKREEAQARAAKIEKSMERASTSFQAQQQPSTAQAVTVPKKEVSIAENVYSSTYVPPEKRQSFLIPQEQKIIS